MLFLLYHLDGTNIVFTAKGIALRHCLSPCMFYTFLPDTTLTYCGLFWWQASSWIDYKVVVGVGEGNSWWLGRFKGVFRYRFGRLDSEVGWFN